MGGWMPEKQFWRSGGEKCFSLDIPFYRTFPPPRRLLHFLRIQPRKELSSAILSAPLQAHPSIGKDSGAVTLLWRCSDLHVDDADSVAILFPILDDLGGLLMLFDFPPEPRYLASVLLSWSSKLVAEIRNNIMKDRETSFPNKRAVIVEISFDPIVGVVAINE